VSPLLWLRVSLVPLCLLVAACSTPISPYSPLEDEDEADDELPIDAGSDAGSDAGARDAGLRDAGGGDASTGGNCGRIPNADFIGSLLDGDCASRPAKTCAASGQSPQVVINRLLADTVARCGGSPSSGFGVSFGPMGCPMFYGTSLSGRISDCIQADLETWRLACRLNCAVTGALAR
jgi:hypothetical protein